MKIGIVIPLKAKAVAKNWDITCRNIKMTLSSIENQTADHFEAIVVGHDCPDFMKIDKDQYKRTSFLNFSEFDPPVKGSDKSENQLRYEYDRCKKILKGVMILKKSVPSITHWFALDADDLLHKDFVNVLQSYDRFDAVILDKGYFYYRSANMINIEDEFSAYCGSSAIISENVFEIPGEITDRSFREIPFGGVSHVHMKRWLTEKGWSVAVPNERIIMYVRDNGENISNESHRGSTYSKIKKYIKMILRFRFSGSALRSDFSIE
ncbi:MAG: hypothetical protein ACX936_04795 [Marinobacter sp.]